MAGAGTLTFSGTLVGLPTGQNVINVVYSIQSAIDVAYEPLLTVGDNTFQIPFGCNGVLIEMPPGNSFIVTLKGAPFEVGIAIHRTFGTPFFFDNSQTSFVLTTQNILAGPVQLKFF